MLVFIYPVNLFDIKYFPEEWKEAKIFLLEDPVYWGTDNDLKLNMNQLKLVLHRGSMKNYEDLLKRKGFQVEYVEEKDLRKGYKFLWGEGTKNDEVQFFDPVDHTLESKIKKELKEYNFKYTKIDSPGFLFSKKELESYLGIQETGKIKKDHFFHANFYKWSKKQLKLQKDLGSKTYDSENRKALPKKISIPDLPKGDQDTNAGKEAIKYIKKNYAKNYGKAEDFYLPLDHSGSKKWFQYFLKKKFDNFGDYQDAISNKEPFLFHSVIAPLINIGLLDVSEVISETVKYYKNNYRSVGKNNFEGFIRQIIGWREYSRMLYVYVYDDIKGNYFNHKKKLTDKWYNGKLGIEPVDWTINVAFKYGYLHHILRLMMMANFMNLVGLHPDEVFKWFMEFSMDSYQWVMHNNIYGMGTYADGGLTMRKPYLSSSNYILKMSNFKKDGKWDTIWTDLFYHFLVEHEKKLDGTPYARNLYHFKKKSDKEQKELLKRAKDFIKSVTK